MSANDGKQFTERLKTRAQWAASAKWQISGCAGVLIAHQASDEDVRLKELSNVSISLGLLLVYASNTPASEDWSHRRIRLINAINENP
jgi:hypothetical protein